MRQLHFDLLRLLEDDRQGSHGSRRARRYVLAQAAETLHRLGYRGLRARGLKGRHIEALVAEWNRQGLADGTVMHRITPPKRKRGFSPSRAGFLDTHPSNDRRIVHILSAIRDVQTGVPVEAHARESP